MKAKFDANSLFWDMNSFDANLMYVRIHQKHFNDLLLSRGYVTIFEVFSNLGLKLDLDELEDKEVKRIWWRYPDNEIIDFGINPIKEENVILLDFNINID